MTPAQPGEVCEYAAVHALKGEHAPAAVYLDLPYGHCPACVTCAETYLSLSIM
ncbi:hypothetical protein GCM10010357_60960 [Streptomyces luteireticuli]|uniref:Uncharacterized protein n=1 Tax=Streptomyces luteireticuli TaxID=173858 RepID=A0ABN0Z383_9ACTN